MSPKNAYNFGVDSLTFPNFSDFYWTKVQYPTLPACSTILAVRNHRSAPPSRFGSDDGSATPVCGLSLAICKRQTSGLVTPGARSLQRIHQLSTEYFSTSRPRFSVSELFSLSIVDDDDLVGRSLKRVIGSTGYQVDVFNSAEAFLDSAELNQCNCLLLDMKMPGLSGLELQQQLQTRNFDFPIIFMTSYVDDFSKAQALDAGAVDFLYKPFKEEQLFSAIDRAFNADKTLIADKTLGAD